jgi:hypothetical protein
MSSILSQAPWLVRYPGVFCGLHNVLAYRRVPAAPTTLVEPVQDPFCATSIGSRQE